MNFAILYKFYARLLLTLLNAIGSFKKFKANRIMSSLENVETGVLVTILAQHTEQVTKLLLRVTMSKEYDEHKKQIDAISEELNRRKQAIKLLQSSYGSNSPYGQTNLPDKYPNV